MDTKNKQSIPRKLDSKQCKQSSTNLAQYQLPTSMEDEEKSLEKRYFLLIYPNSRFKITWDLIIIILSVYNAILVPYEFAYTIHKHILIQIFDRVVDVAFVIDIMINFRTGYFNSKTGKLIMDSK